MIREQFNQKQIRINMFLLKRFLFLQLSSISFLCVMATPLFGEIPKSSLEVMPPMNQIYHPVSTTNSEAQKSFDRGLTYIFAFNHDIAFSEFEKTSKLDPNLAMAYWGMALALGQNVNDDVTPEREIRCYNYIQKALQLAPNASRIEQDYIAALASRYTNNPNVDLTTLRAPYRDAMKKLVEAYPEDIDAASMYAESILDLDPWKWWTVDQKPIDATLEAIDVLNFVLARNPDHIGANHYYVHAFEESPYPERALMSAHRLEYLLPESGHLLHMPCHIFLLVGDYESAVRTSKKAIAQDKDYFQKVGLTAGTYPVHYLTHNLYVLARTYMLMENYQKALNTALEITKFVEPFISSMHHLAYHTTTQLEIYLYFHKWKEILDFQLTSKYPPAETYWHYSRAVAYASLGDLDSAQKEKELMLKAKEQVTPADEIAKNPASKVLELPLILLDATLAKVQKKYPEYIEHLKKAIEIQDKLYYDEPPPWYLSTSQTLGFALLQQKQYVEAEKAFGQTLKNLQRNGRTLFGLSLSLKGQGRTMDAYWIEREMTTALKHASVSLHLDDM